MSMNDHDPEQWTEFYKELEAVINKYSKENQSDTPDFILAEYLRDCLHAYNAAVVAREKWYGRKCGNGAAIRRELTEESDNG
jgi:hypothetical protein